MALLLLLIVLLGGVIALGMYRATALQWALALAAITFAWQAGIFHGTLHFPSPGFLSLLAWLPPIVLAALSFEQVRRPLLIEPAFKLFKGILPKVSDTEQQALDAGTVGFDAEIFSGTPDWTKLRAIPPIVLSPEEQAFLDGPTDELCRMIDHWDIRHGQREISEEIW